MISNVGRGVINKKRLVEDCYQLDILTLSRIFDLEWFYTLELGFNKNRARIGVIIDRGYVKLRYEIKRKDGTSTEYEYSIKIDKTRCYFGGVRYWFRCLYCDRRCRILYMPYNREIFKCRLCYNLTYRTQQEGIRANIFRFF